MQLLITLFLCGDVMTGRGIDQVLPHAGDPTLHESYVRDARRYVELAERVNGPIDQPVAFEEVWGDALDVLREVGPDARIINLETSITTSDDHWRGKGIHYRMHPSNVGVIKAAEIDCCVLANNHVLDWGYEGLRETLRTLREADIQTTGAGENAEAAAAPAVLPAPGGGRVLVFAFGSLTSGVPRAWEAKRDNAGVNLLGGYSDATLREVMQLIRRHRRENDVVVFSVHWGGNWGYDVPQQQRDFAHRLIDEAGVDIVHGHSSHHVKAIEVHHGRLILYGCGDFLNDYEGIGGHEQYRPDLALMYFPQVDAQTGSLTALRMAPMQVRKLRLHRARQADAHWLRMMLGAQGGKFGVSVEIDDEGMLVARWR